MAYEQQTWQPFQEGGTIITSDALNHMEQGIYDAHADNAAQASDLELLTADLTAVNSSLTSVTGRVTTAETNIGSIDSRVASLESNPVSAARVADLTMLGFIYGTSQSGAQYGYIYNTASWHIVRVGAEASATECGITTWDGDDTLYGSVYGSGFQLPNDCNVALVTASFASNDSKAATEGRRILQVFAADEDGNPLGLASPIVYDHEDTYGDRPAFTLSFAPGSRVSIAVKWPVQHSTPSSGVWAGKIRVTLL